jgi:hypothetical protein
MLSAAAAAAAEGKSVGLADMNRHLGHGLASVIMPLSGGARGGGGGRYSQVGGFHLDAIPFD